MNCARIALDKLDIPIETYYSSEIDKYAIQVTQHNHPDTIQVGDICKVKGSDLGWIDLICGGSPCQGFSMAGKMLNFDDPRSKLFFEFVRIYKELKKINPNIKFFLENVRMQKWCQDVISRYLGVYPVQINSNLVSAQNRDRWYWTNISFNRKIKDKGLVLKDILETNVDEKYFLSDKLLKTFSLPSGKNDSFFFKETIIDNKAQCLTARYHKMGRTDTYISDRSPKQLNECKKSGGKQPFQQDRIYDANFNNPALLANLSTGSNYIQYDLTGKGNDSQDQKIFFEDSKMNCLSASRTESKTKIFEKGVIRRLTPVECERLQTVPDNFTASVSETQRYKMLGNGWTIDIIAHIFQGLKEDVKTNNRQFAASLF